MRENESSNDTARDRSTNNLRGSNRVLKVTNMGVRWPQGQLALALGEDYTRWQEGADIGVSWEVTFLLMPGCPFAHCEVGLTLWPQLCFLVGSDSGSVYGLHCLLWQFLMADSPSYASCSMQRSGWTREHDSSPLGGIVHFRCSAGVPPWNNPNSQIPCTSKWLIRWGFHRFPWAPS